MGILRLLESSGPERIEKSRTDLGVVNDLVTCMVAHPTNDLLLLGTSTGKLILWDAAGQHATQIVQGHERDVTRIEFLPDGGKVLSASLDGTLQWWDDQLQPSGTTLTAGSPINAISISPDGRRIAAGCQDCKLHVWNAETGEPLFNLAAHQDPITVVTWLNSNTVVSFGEAGNLKAWDVDGKRTIRQIKGHEQHVSQLLLSHDKSWYASGCWDGSIKVWSISHREKYSLPSADKAVTGLALSNDDRLLVASHWGGEIRIWDTVTGKLVDQFSAHEGALVACALVAGGHYLVTCNQDGHLRSWNMAEMGVFSYVNRHHGEVYAAQYTPDNLSLITLGHDGALKVWSRDDRAESLSMEAHHGPATAFAIAPDNSFWAIGTGQGEIKLWNVAEQSFDATLAGHKAPISCLRYTPRGDGLISGSWDMKLRLWSMKNNRIECSFDGHTKEVEACDVSLDGRRLISASWDGLVALWDLVERRRDVGKLISYYEGHSGRVLCCAFSPDGTIIAAGSADQTVRMWRTGAPSESKTLHGHKAEVTGCRFTPDGQYLVSADRDGYIKVWDSSNGEPVDEAASGRQILCMAMAPDGLQVAFADAGGTVSFWDLEYSLQPSWLAAATTIKKPSVLLLGAPSTEAYEVTCVYCGHTEMLKFKQLGKLWKCSKCAAHFMICPVGLPPSEA